MRRDMDGKSGRNGKKRRREGTLGSLIVLLEGERERDKSIKTFTSLVNNEWKEKKEEKEAEVFGFGGAN